MFRLNYVFNVNSIPKFFDFGENDQFKPKNYNLPSCMTFAQAVLKQIS